MRHRSVFSVVPLVAQRCSRGKEEGSAHYDRDEWEAEEEEGMVSKVATIGSANALAESRDLGGGGTERVGLEGRHCELDWFSDWKGGSALTQL